MVTTAARENMARLCGALGVEHILVSPNIRKNRIRIRRALTAWLKHPRLGTLPILMAGDKPYFRWAGTIAKERGGLPAVMADHPLETTGFKSMLAGARPRPNDDGGVLYRLDNRSLARMIASYSATRCVFPGCFRHSSEKEPLASSTTTCDTTSSSDRSRTSLGTRRSWSRRSAGSTAGAPARSDRRRRGGWATARHHSTT